MFTKQVEGESVIIRFEVVLTSSRPPEDVWRALEQSLIDSKQSWIWPDEHSVMVARETPLRVGCLLITTYTMGTPDAPEDKAEFTHEYTLAQYDPDAMLLEYRAQPEHPFQGGAVVRTVPQDGGGSEIRWVGTYVMPRKFEHLGDQFGWYLSVFFGSVEKCLRAREAGSTQ